MISVYFADVVNKLILPLILVEGTIALVNAQGVADVVASDGIIDIESRQTGGIEVVNVQAGDTRLGSRTASDPIGNIRDVVVQESEAKFIN
jgi:hypothetical protein